MNMNWSRCMDDRELAENVRSAAAALAKAMNAAGNAGLRLDVKITPHQWETLANGEEKVTHFAPYVSVSRTNLF
jgi:hypothetical protein